MEPFFLSVGDGQRFCVFHPAAGPGNKGAVLYIHPFAEEMNKSRRMAALQSRALAAAGYDVLQMDLLGCGDSTGDFRDVSWRAWQEDVLAGCSCLRERSSGQLILWGLRAGCLLAVEAAAELSEAVDFVFWQPVISGKQHWQQFMRLKMAGEITSGQAKAVGEQLRRQLADGQEIEIVGYRISPELPQGLEQTELMPPPGRKGRVVWLEVSLRNEALLAPVAQKRIEQWQIAGYSVNAGIARGAPFWQTTEIEDAPALIVATLTCLEEQR